MQIIRDNAGCVSEIEAQNFIKSRGLNMTYSSAVRP